MINDRLTELLSRKLSGEATAAELQELQHWLQSNPGDQYFTEILLTYWHHRPDHHLSLDRAPDQHFAHILEMATVQNEAAESSRKPALLRRIGKFAAAAAFISAIAGAAWVFMPKKAGRAIAADVKKNEVVAGKGIRSKMVLPDGTQVWLNSDSKLQYAESFSGETREVSLEGEAFFDVVKDPKRPFIVHTSAIDIRVLGTSFNVKSYPQEKTIETTLIHGLIEVINKNKPQSPKIILRPKEKLVFNKLAEDIEGVPVNKRKENATTDTISNRVMAIAITALPPNVADSSLSETSWVYNRLLFEGDSFREVAVKMERWFNIKINFKNEKVANYRLSGSFDRETIDEALQALKYIAPFNYKINNNEVDITN
jgi:transmembrane sensor